MVHDIKHLPQVLENATLDSLVIFDVDEVLVYPKNIIQLQIASPFWDAYMANLEKRLGKTTRDLLHSIMLLQSDWALLDHEMPKLINHLQLKKIQTLALTSFRRGILGKIPSIEAWRSAQLKKHNIDFRISAGLQIKSFEINKSRMTDMNRTPVYQDGIIYTDLHSKSEVLSAFLEQTHLKPKEIIFIDDRISNVQDIENFCKTSDINFIGIHDDRILKKHACFDENLGKYQFHCLEHFQIWLSDAEALKQMAESQI